MARVRTLDFLPEVFQTPTNAEFLAATLDQIVNPPNTTRIQGYVGSKFGYGINATDRYVLEPTKVRTDYQLDPGVVFTKTNESVAKDFISYPGIIDALKLAGGATDNNSRMFDSQFYSWDAFTDLDKLINFNEYYWLPYGPPAVTVAQSLVYSRADYRVTDNPNSYSIVELSASGTNANPTLTLLRGGIYTFLVDQATQFWIQSEPGTSGFSANFPNIPVRDVYGVENNGANLGVVTFNVPQKDAQNEYILPGKNPVDLISTTPFSEVNGVQLSELGNIDGVTGLEGLRVAFYNTGVPNEIGFVSQYYSEDNFDVNNNQYVPPLTVTITSCNTTTLTIATGDTSTFTAGQSITFDTPTIGGLTDGQVYYVRDIVSPTQFTISDYIDGPVYTLTADTGTMTANINQGLLEEGFYTNVSENYYRITYVGNPDSPVLRLIPDGVIPIGENIIPIYGELWSNRPFYRDVNGVLNLLPQITAPSDILYYQDSTNPNKVGIIRIVESNNSNTLNVDADILTQANFTATNGVAFTNGLKVRFNGDVIPASYLEGEYYVEGVGTRIELVPVDSLVCPEAFTQGGFIPWDTAPYDIGNFDIELFIPVEPDYITIARNSISKNAWSRSNRWFHASVINATAGYNNNPNILTEYANSDNKARRPIIEFYPNLKLFNSGSQGKAAVDFVDTRATDALSTVAGLKAYYPDVETYTANTATIASTVTTPTSANALVVGATYQIAVLGNTDWNIVAGTASGTFVVGEKIICVAAGTGTGTATFLDTTTTITVSEDDVTGSFQVGMYVGDTDDVLPVNTQITSISGAGTGTLALAVEWLTPQNTVGATNVSIVGTDTTVNNYGLFTGARIVFAADTDPNTLNKIYVAELSTITPGAKPTITLSLAEDGNVLVNEQVAVLRGYNYQGKSFYYNGVEWLEAQLKSNVNEPPLFDVFDDNDISFGDSDIYSSTTFTGCKLFAYGISDTTIDDPILGFPVRYSAIDNLGDISFDVSLNLDTFNYVAGGAPITQKVNTGYVYNFTDLTAFDRELGWQTAIAPSVQYQAFEFNFTASTTPNYFTCDVAKLPDLALDELGWSRIQVFINNRYLTEDEYQVYGTSTSTVVILNQAPVIDTAIQILLLSDQVSKTAYYTIPINLNNNPFNTDLETADIGDIRLHYRDIFINAPNTSGEIFGNNNFRDCGDLVSYGTKIIQNSASLVLPGTFLRKQNHDLFSALMFNSREYIKYKQLLVDTVQNSEFVQRYTPSEMLDDALDQITAAKSQGNAFFWSDMLPGKAAFRTNTYTFANSLDTSIYPLTQIYNFETANYNGVLVYLSRTVDNNTVQTQLISGVDYTISTDSPSLTVTLDLIANDKITIKEYNQTYGSYVPNTPTKLGLYSAFQPTVVLDADYTTPTYFILGHDGSYTKLYGEYIPETNTLLDFVDQVLLEFEKRIYNNLKLGTEVVIKDYEVLPGFFRDSDYSWEEWLAMYTPNFLNWIGQNRLDYKTQFYNRNDFFTYNYTNSQEKLTREPIKQGYWRGLYEYFYDTVTPNSTPWQMLGFADEPTWWQERYGPAPYTSDNLLLWQDLEAGFVWNNGESLSIPELARPGLTQVLPVDSNGDIVAPWTSIVGNYNPSTFQKDWKIGDMGPVELSYRRSSTWPFDLVKLFALTKPAEFYNLAVDLDTYKYNIEFNQYLVNNRSHLIISDVEIYGNGTAKTSYINWIVDYEKQLGIDATTNITTLLDNLDVRLVYRLAGYSDKNLLQFYVEKGSPNSNNASLLIPDESYSVLLYDNQPYDKLSYSSVVVQSVDGGYTVYGNSQTFSYFTIKEPIFNGKWVNYDVTGATTRVAEEYSTTDILVPYGTKFYTIQEVAQFLASYGAWTQSKGMIFQEIESGIEINWRLMIQEFMYWTQTGWVEGSVLTLNPAATVLELDKASTIVQPLTVQNQNFILNQNLYPVQLNNICVLRDGTRFRVHTLNQGDAFSYAQFNLSNFEHGIVFNNETLFNDTIYNLTTGLRQNRIYLRGTKTAEWNGTVDAWGFVLNQDNVEEWSRDLKYTKGSIVLYKNKYWAALMIVEPSSVFNELEWKEIDYADIQKGLLPNASTRAYESTLYYDINNANLENDADLLSYSLIGYRPRDYLALADLTDVTQINVYRNLIRDKGTLNAANAFKGANLPQGGIDYTLYENWAILSGEYGGLLNDNFVEFKLDQPSLTGNPSIVSLNNGIYTPGAQQEVSLYSLFNYGRLPESPNILSTTTETYPVALYPNAGYVNFNDVKMASYYYAGLPSAINRSGTYIPVNQFYVRDYLWLANFKEKWAVYSWKPIAEVIQVRGNINDTATITFSKPHGLSKLDPIAIINFADNIDGYYIVSDIVNLNQIIINLTAPTAQNTPLIGRGLGMKFVNQRVATPADIKDLDLLEAEFTKNTVWVDENTDGGWAVYRKNINYQLQTELSRPISEFETGYGVTFGSSVAYTSQAGYLIGDAGAGKVYRYAYNLLSGDFNVVETLINGTSFGAKIVYGQNVYAISEPTSVTPAVYLYIINNSVVSDDMTDNASLTPEPYQTILAPGGVTDWGSQLAMSDDANWIYISDIDNDQVYVYRRQNFSLTAGYFAPTETYVITSLGTTDFTAIGAVENKVGITFVATGAGSGTGTATQSSYKFATIIDGSLEVAAGSNFGSAIATDYKGDTVIIGAPNVDYSMTVNDWGKALVYQRRMQNVEVQYTSIPNEPQVYSLGWTPTSLPITVTAIDSIGLVCADTSLLTTNDPVLFSGSVFSGSDVSVGGIVYYVEDVVDSTHFTIKTSRSSSTAVTINNFTPSVDAASSIVPGQTYRIVSVGNTNFTAIGASANTVGVVFTATTAGTGTGTASKVMIANVQTNPLYVSVNGTLVADNNYAIVSDKLYYVGAVNGGDIVNISDSGFDFVQEVNSQFNDRPGIQFGYALDCDTQGAMFVVGAPYEINSDNVEGAAYTYVNGGARYGIVIGTNECNITADRNLLLNGYLVPLTAGNATLAAQIINGTNITNIQASATADNKLIIQVINTDLSVYNEKLLVAADSTTLSELGIELYTNTQIVTIPHVYGQSQFGKAIKFNDSGSLLVSAPVGTRFAATTFDFTDDENLDNDTVFDNNGTRFIDEYPNAGAVYMFDYLGTYNENLLNSGKFVYAQAVNYTQTDYGFNPYYGEAIEFNDNVVMVGAPDFIPAQNGGLITVFDNASGIRDWSEFRQSSPIVDVNKIQNSQIFSAETNNTLANLDYMDPLQGKLLGVVRENLDYIAGIDPAKYNSDLADLTGYNWGSEQVGQLWFNTNNIRFMNYHQNDVVYNSEYWGTLFPGSDIAVCTWVVSNVPPSQYQGPGIPFNNSLYCVGSTFNASGVVVPIYYFWARNTNVISEHREKTLSDFVIANYISNPRGSGVAYMAPLLPNTFALYNCSSVINANDSVFHIGYANGTSDDVGHQEFTLIRQNYPDDFLPGLPNSVIMHGNNTNVNQNVYNTQLPSGLYDRMLDSLSGCDEDGQVVPNPFLPKAVQSGVLARPRQSFFFDRFDAVKNYLIYANDVLAQFPITETRPNATFLFASGEFYDTADYWEYVNWWAVGYDNNTKSVAQVGIYSDLATLNVAVNTLVTVEQNGAGKFEVYRYDGEGVWTRVGLENGTIQFKTFLWDYAAGKFGFSGDFFDNTSYDLYPSEETRYIIRALNEQIYLDELVEFRNKSLIILFEYIQSETMESQNYLPWLNKTSLLDVSHTIRELRPVEVFQSDNQDFLEGYINEVKPYHVVIKEFIFSYKGQEDYLGNFTDFDLPATYNTTYQKFISPQLVYGTPSTEYQYSETSDIWNNPNYSAWFENYGVSITGEDNYPITTLVSYVSLSSNYIIVDNAQGFPINGVIRIGDEDISYAYVDRALNILGGLVRGLNNTTTSNHLPNEQVYIDLPAVVVLSGGSNYSEPPQITAHIDLAIYPEPTEAAVFEAVMSNGAVQSVTVINPGKGYAVLPELLVDPSEEIYFTNNDINSELHTVRLYAPNLRTGDLVKFRSGTSTTGPSTVSVGKLVDDQWYYINVLEDTPTAIIAFYTNYANSLQDHDRIAIFVNGESTNLSIAPGAKVSAISSSAPIRENNITLRFDRTTYGSQVQDWRAGAYYGSFFAGSYYNSESVSSSNILLDNEFPDINTILASAQGATFEIVDVTNDQELSWSSFIRYVLSTKASTDAIRLVPQSNSFSATGSISNGSGASGTTLTILDIESGTIEDGTFIYGSGIDPDTYIVTQLSGTTGGVGTYQLSIAALTGNIQITGYDLFNYKPNTSGTTVGFYEGMPIKFVGAVIGGLVNSQTYYVKDIINDLDFTVSATVGGATLALSDASASLAGLECYAGEVVNTAVLTVNYPGILEVTATTSGTNALTVPTSAIGTGGTYNFYTNLPVFFTGDVIGGIIENEPYYITTVIDEETFTLSTTQNPLMIDVSATIDSTDTVVLSSVDGIAINTPIIFVDLVGATGGIVQGTTYYVSAIDTVNNEIKIALTINGTPVNLSNSSVTGTLISQAGVVTLTTATGTMTMNVSLPVSPGQINGQLFTLYGTSPQYPDITSGTVGDKIIRTVNATVDTSNVIAISSVQGGTSFFYKNMPVSFDISVGGLSPYPTYYYIVEFSGMDDPLNPGEVFPNIQVQVVSTSSTGNLITVDVSEGFDTDSLYVGMPIVFSGNGFGNIVIDQEYFVASIPSSTTFTIKETLIGSTFVLQNGSGLMIGTGDPYVKVSTTPNGSAVALSPSVASGAIMTQYIITPPIFDMSYVVGGYRAIIQDGGSGFAINNTITISGVEVGGTAPANNITLTVNTVDASGVITSVICAGTAPGQSNQYYLKVISPTQLEVYSDPLMNVPVSGIGFAYEGFTTTTVTETQASTDTLTLTDTTGFEVNDAIVFTGNVAGNVVASETYYIVDVTGNDIQISENPGGSAFALATALSTNFTAAKPGSVALLPEPFYFNQSIVKFNGRVYVCIISNDDPEFVLGKWELLDSGDRRLNAMDRTIGYYNPTVNMPGVDLSQLFEGVTYPNSIYKGNAFQPSQQFELDTILQDQPFYPNEVDMTGIVYDGEKYVACANLPTYTGIVQSEDAELWDIGKLTNAGIGASDMVYNDGLYVMTSTNPATPVFRSQDGIVWTTNGYYTPYGYLPYDESPYDSTSLSVSALSLNSVAYGNGIWVAVGENIVTSPDTYIWSELTNFDPVLQINLYSVQYVTLVSFTGWIAVGKGKRYDYSTGITELVDTSYIYYSFNGINWSQVQPVTDKALYGIASDGVGAIAIGDEGVRFYSENGYDWFGMNEANVVSFSETNYIIEVSPSVLQLNQEIKFNTTFSDIVAGTSYYVKQIVSPTLITISDTLGGSVKTLTADTVPANTILYSYEVGSATILDLSYSNSIWMGVGNEGRVLTSPDGLVWTDQDSGTENVLRGITYNNTAVEFVVVGQNNTIIASDDAGVTWNSTSLFAVTPSTYDVQGAAFEFGYGPEELVPGLIADNLVMTVSTRPGTNWPVEEYAHAGFNAVSIQLTPTSGEQTEYSFDGVVNIPAQVAVQVLDAATELGTTLSISDYSVDWLTKKVVLNSPIDYLSPTTQSLRIDVYEVGNGDQLVKSNTNIDPIRTNSVSGFNEIYLNCNYSGLLYTGSGVFQLGTSAQTVLVTETDGVTNRLTCEDVSNLVVNSSITFQGAVFGNIVEGTPYFVKSISAATKTITISDSFNGITGVAGPTFSLSTDTGTMYINLQVGNGLVWTDPIIYHNGVQMVFGVTGLISKLTAGTNAITTSSTSGMSVGQPIVFCEACGSFGNVIQPMVVYYINSIIDGNEFTISATQGGPVLPLDSSTGGARFITNDYAIGLQPNNIQAKLMFPTDSYTSNTDYIVYSIFGQTYPEQYGFALPQTQEFVGNGSQASFALNNFVGDDNPTNAIVQIDGLRQTLSSYSISFATDTILFFDPPANGSVISVTSYNDTNRQYLTSQYNITGNPESSLVSYTVGSSTRATGAYDQTNVPAGPDAFAGSTQAYDQGPGDPISTTVAGDFNIGIVYTIATTGTTDFTLIGAANSNPGTVFTATGVGTGTGTAFATVEVLYDEFLTYLTLSSGSTTTLNINDPVVFDDDIGGSVIDDIEGILADTTYYVIEILSSTDFIVSSTVGGSPVDLVSETKSVDMIANGLTVAPIATITNDISPPLALTNATASASSTDEITVTSTSGFIVGQTVEFTGTSFGGILTNGTVYFVDSISLSGTEFTISATPGGSLLSLSNGSGNMQVVVGGKPSVRVTTTIDHNFETNTLIRIDGVLGATQLNGNAYYARVIDDITFDLYTESYVVGAANYPVTTISAYTGGGYTWRAGLFYLSSATVTETNGTTITADSIVSLVIDTPIYFSKIETVSGTTFASGLESGVEYYVKTIDSFAKTFSVSTTRGGDAFALTSSLEVLNATQWSQENVDRLWVTVNGYRIPSSKLTISPVNEVGILTEIQSGDQVIITSMIPNATPDEEIYINIVDAIGNAAVYRQNSSTTTWVTQPVYDLSNTIYVNDVTQITEQTVQTEIIPAAVNGYYYVGLDADKNLITSVTVVNNTTSQTLPASSYSVVLDDLTPTLQITSGVTVGNSVTITVLQGNTIYVNGEFIGFTEVDVENNALIGLYRGNDGTPAEFYIPEYAKVFGLLSSQRLPDVYYDQTWNSYVWNTTLGDPLQISDTIPANFLKADIS
jgi:hypothetical protein